jgi:two-component system, NtrC family, response regulator HydG
MKVLVVDDDRRIIRTSCDILRLHGHEAVAASSGEDAVQKVRSETPDCVLMDIKMPGSDGVETMKQMHRVAPDLPVVLVSAHAADNVVQEAMRAGAYAVLGKPLNFPMLLSFLALLGKEESILVVDDDPDFCRTLKDALTLRGYRVATETEPRNVLKHPEADYELAVVVDLKLGDVNGVDVLREIRARYPGKPVVLVTGFRQEMGMSIRKGLEIGAHTCLYKPFAMGELLQVLKDIRMKKLGNSLATV